MNHETQGTTPLCSWHQFGGGDPCLRPAVGPRAQKLHNFTDSWVWCEEHGGVRTLSSEHAEMDARQATKEDQRP